MSYLLSATCQDVPSLGRQSLLGLNVMCVIVCITLAYCVMFCIYTFDNFLHLECSVVYCELYVCSCARFASTYWCMHPCVSL